MFSQGSFNPQSGQGPQGPRPPPYLQHPSAPPVLSNNFQQGPLLPSPQVPPHLPIYQHGPMGLHFAARQVPSGGMPNSGQPYLPPPPTIHGSSPMPHLYTIAQQKIQHSSYVAPGSAPPPPVSHNSDMLQAIPPIPSQGSLYRAPPHQMSQQPGGVQGLFQIPPPPPPLPSTNFSPSAQYVSSLDPAVGNSQTSSMAPPIPLPLPPPPPPPPLPAAAAFSSPPPVLPCSPPPISSSAPASMPLPTDSLFQEGANGSKLDTLRADGLSSQRTMTSVNPPPPKPREEKIIRKIEEICQLIAKNGPSYEDFTRRKECENPEFNFLFGGEPGSEAAMAHNYFLWMKTQCYLSCKVNGMVSNMTTNNLTIATEPNASADSDMEMEDDITGSEIDQAVSPPIEDEHQATGSINNRFEAKEHLHMLSRSTIVDASMIFSDEKLLSGSSRLAELGSKLVSSHDDETLGRSVSGVEGPVNVSAGDGDFPFASYKDDSSKPITGAKKLPREEAAVADIMSSDKYSSEAMKGCSPFRLLQEYASDDSSQNDKDPCSEDANPERVSQLVAGSGYKLHRDTGLNLKVDSGSNRPYKTEKGIEPLSESCQNLIAPKSVAGGSISEHIEIKNENHSSRRHVASPKATLKEDVSAGPCASVAFSSKCEKNIEDKSSRLPSNAQKIDKFGRLVREGASDSDSDDSHHARRRRKRGRSWSRSRSRSRSPLDRRRRRRRRRSPRRRREKRSRSRSLSPRNRRSRSRSPSFRHAAGYSSNSIRRDRGQIPECFDFLRGKCYRGASCRFMHHGSEKSEGSRHHRSKQQHVQLPASSKNCNSRDDNVKLSTKESYHEQETIHQEVQQNHDVSVTHATKGDIFIDNREDSVSITVVDSENLREVAAEVPKSKVVQEGHINDNSSVHGTFHEATDPDQVVADSFPSKLACEFGMLTPHAEASKDMLSSSKSFIEQSQMNVSDPVLVNADNTAQETDDSSISDSQPNQISKTSPKKLCLGETLPNVDSMQNSSQLPTFPTSGPNVESNNAPQMTQLPRDYNLNPQTATNQSQSASLKSFPSYMLPRESSLFSVTSVASLPQPLPPLPLPPHIPTLNLATATLGVNSQFHRSGLPPRSDFGSQMLRPYSTGNSQVSDFQHWSYPPVHEPHQSILHSEDFRLKPLSGSNLSDSRFGLLGEDSLKWLPVQGLSASNAFAQSSHYPQPTSFLQEPPTDNVPSGEILKSSQIRPHLQQQQLPYDLHNSVRDSVYGVPGKLSAPSRYPADLHDINQPLNLPDFGVTRSSTHFNPYASTFEKPLSSRFSSNVFKPEKDPTYSNKHDHPSNLSRVSVDEQGVGSRQGNSSSFSAREVGRALPRAGEDQYDPLFDSIEPSSNSYKKSDHVQTWEPPGSSDIVLRPKESNLPLDVEENNKKKDFGGIALATSPDNEEFGETADAEVGDVENGSQSDPDALANTDMGEMEIDQIKSSSKSKKSKESRTMKLFKVCLADFVKEVLKPSWRQGNMSKEAFKTVVKKTVDKVSRAMKSHQVPKSKAKINQYIDSSQRKLTKLVMGYVDKYAKG